MDTANLAAIRRPELVADHDVPSAPEAVRHLTVLAVYELSETGRKASLLAGGDGRALQQLKVQVPANRLHLVTVDARGTARLKLRPRFEMDAEQRVVRKDTAPVYEVPPTLETLIHEAARNHQLERVYKAERNLARLKRREADQARRTEVAEAFLADKSQRALVHPTPSPTRCSVVTSQGRILFDVATDVGVARNVPAEAHRRFRVDLAARKEKNLRERAAQLALHEEKKRFVSEWIEMHGTPDQKERQAAGTLAPDEAIELIAAQVFAPLACLVPYRKDGTERLNAHLRTQGLDAHTSRQHLLVETASVQATTAEGWRTTVTILAALPESSIVYRRHRISADNLHAKIALVLNSVVVTQRVGPLTLRREFEVTNEGSDTHCLPGQRPSVSGV